MDSLPQVFEPVVTPEEWQTVPSEVGQKLVNFVNEQFEELITAKALLETRSFNSEKLATELKAEIETVRSENETLNARLKVASESSQECQTQMSNMSSELVRLQFYANKLETEAAEFRNQRSSAEDERDDCIKMAERRKAELERMQMDLTTLTKQLEDATRTKCEALVDAEEVKSMKVSLEYREKRLEQERELMQAQIDNLTSDLHERTEELFNMRRDNTSRCIQLENKLADKTQELAVAVEQCNSVHELNQTMIERNEELALKLLQVNETHAKTNESYVCEIEAKTKMANVYRAMGEQSQKHAEELQKALTEVQELLNLNTEKYGELETKLKESELSNEEIVAKKNDYIAMLNKELETANEVIEKFNKDSMHRDFEGISNAATNVSRGLLNDSTGTAMSYTSLYSAFVNLKEQLSTKDEECARLNNYIACIVKEVEEKGPLIKQLRTEYGDCLDMQEALKSENESLMAELEQLREVRAENHRMESKVARENERMKKEVADLSRQVVHLLQEVEHSRIGSSSALSSDNDMSDSVCSADIISKRLVTFNDIAELQATNQKLLALVRELTERQEEVESYDPAAVANLQRKLKELQDSQMELLAEREQQSKMMAMLRNQRDMYKKSFGHDTIGAGGEPMERSFSHQDDSASGHSDSKSDEKMHELKQQIEKYKKELVQSKEEYDQYRKERLEHEKILLEQIETIRNESKELQKANGKLASQSEYNEERFKIFQNNVEIYKKQIQALEKQNKIYSESLIKHEHTANYLKEDALQNQTKASKAEVQLANIQKENALLRDAEKRLTRESEMLRKHSQQQNLLTSNIELIKATLERNEAESKLHLEAKLDEAHLECSALRRRLEEEQNHFRELTQHLEKSTKQAQDRMEEYKSKAEALRLELIDTRRQLSDKVSHIEELSRKLKSSVFQIQDVGVESRKLREMEQQLADSQAEIESLKYKLTTTKESSDNFYNIAQNAEKQLEDLTVEHEKCVLKISEKEKQVQQLTEKLAEMQAELSIQMDDQDISNADIKNQKQQLQEELQGQTLTLKQTKEQLELAKSDLKLLSDQLKASDHKYTREVALHSSDLQLLQDLKRELQEAKDLIRVIEVEKQEAVENLNEHLLSKEEQAAILNSEKEKLEARFKTMDEQNSLLLNQIEELNRQLTIIQGQADNAPANTSFNEDAPDSNRLLTIVKYLRQEKDLAVSKADIVEAEHFRLKSQFEAMKNQLEEAQSLYEAERQKSEIKNVTAAKHAEVLRQLETFNAVTDSNRSLRQERDALANEIRELQARADQLEASVAPLQEVNRDLMQKSDQMQTENISLRGECTRWRQRANQLIEKTNRTSPEDWKKLQTERETLAKQLTVERGNNAKLTEENATLKQRLDKMEQEVKSLKSQNHGLVEEVSRLKDQVTLLGSNLKQVQENLEEVNKTNVKLTEDNRVFSEELTTKEASVTELKNNLAQVKKIAKKYKTQCEEQVKDIEVKEQQTEQMMNKEKQLELEKAGLEDRVNQLEISHKDALEQLRVDKEQLEQNLTKEIEALKQAGQEKEDKFKTLFKSAKDRIMSLTEQNTALKEEVSKQEKDSTTTSTSTTSSNTVSADTDANKNSDLMEKIQQLEQEKEALQEKLQQEKVARAQEMEALKLMTKPNSCSSAMMSSEKSSMERPTADIKPIPGHSTNTQTQSVPIQPWRSVGEPPLASIRPMSQQLRTAAVLPTTQTPSAAVMVPPQQQVHTTGSSSIEALSSSSPTSSHTDYVPATSSASSPMLGPRQVAVPPTQSSEDDDSNMQVQAAPTQQQALAVVSPRVEPPSSGGATQEQGTSSSSSNTVTTTQAGLKRQRDADTDSCQAEEKSATKQQSKRSRLQQASDSGLEVEYQVPTSSQRDQDDDNVIVVESDDEAGPDEGECDEQDEPDDTEVYDDMEEGMEQDNYDDADCQDVEDEEEAGNEVEVIEDSSEVPNQSHGEIQEAREAAENSLDEEQAQSEAISSGTDAAAAGPSSSVSPAVAASTPFSRSRLVPPLHRHQPLQNLLDETALDDGIVPSTPTLFAPRRSDGFGEAVSSPHVPSSATGRFTFNESQVVQPSRGGGDYSVSEVPQVDNVDNSTGRSVPTTPLQSSPQESIPNLIDEHGGDGQAQSDAEIPQIVCSPDEEETRGEGSSAEVMMGPPSQAGTSSEENRQENEVEVEDAVSSEGEKQPQAEEGEEEGREAEASPSPNEARRTSRGNGSARRSLRISHSSRGPQRMGPTPIVWGDQRMFHRHSQQHGVLKNRFRCLLKDRVLHYEPFKAGQIVNAVCVLHNLCIRANLDLEDEDAMADEDVDDPVDEELFPRNIVAEGQQRRTHLIQMYFQNHN